jgi:kynurenine formamidase
MSHTRYFNLTHPMRTGMTIYPGDPQPMIGPAEGVPAPWKVSALQLGSHTGTHIDAANHYIPHGKTIDQYSPERFILPGIVADAGRLPADGPISPEHLVSALNCLPEGGALILRTLWDRYWDTPNYMSHPYLSNEAAQSIRSAGASLVGIDALNIDSTTQGLTDAHEILLGSDILIVENLTGLARLQADVLYQFSFLPLNLVGGDGSPIRAVAWEP